MWLVRSVGMSRFFLCWLRQGLRWCFNNVWLYDVSHKILSARSSWGELESLCCKANVESNDVAGEHAEKLHKFGAARPRFLNGLAFVCVCGKLGGLKVVVGNIIIIFAANNWCTTPCWTGFAATRHHKHHRLFAEIPCAGCVYRESILHGFSVVPAWYGKRRASA